MRILFPLAAALLVACGAVTTTGPTPTPRVPLTVAELKYHLVDAVGRPWFCDPDEYPVARGDEGSLAAQRLPEIRADAETFEAIVAHLRLAPSAAFTADQQLVVYREWKMLNALRLQPAAASYAFQIRVAQSKAGASLVEGTVDRFGDVSVQKRTPSGPPICPICLAAGTRIATPEGEILVEELRPGAAVWTLDADGRRAAVAVREIASVPVPPEHEVADLALDDGRALFASPGHPTADGRRVGALVPGDVLDGARVVRATRVRYAGGATYDLLPSGPTRAYWANGVLLGSTLRP